MRRLFLTIALLVKPLASCAVEPPHLFTTVAELAVAPGNIALTKGSPQKVVVSLHQFFLPTLKVIAVTPEGRWSPFPNGRINQPEGGALSLDSVLGITTDSEGVVWMLDNGMVGKTTPKLVGWDAKADKLHKLIYIPKPVSVDDSFLNDLAVDAASNTAYIADPAGGKNAAIIVVDLESGLSRRALEGDKSVIPEDIDLVIDGKPVQVKTPAGDLVKPKVGINPIALDAKAQTLYYGPMHGASMYRISTAMLKDEDVTAADLSAGVERYSDKPICDGIAMDRDGNIYLGDIANNAIGMIDAEGRYHKLMTDAKLSWVDAFAISEDQTEGYAVANQLHRSERLNAGSDITRPPFLIVKFALPIDKSELEKHEGHEHEHTETPESTVN